MESIAVYGRPERPSVAALLEGAARAGLKPRMTQRFDPANGVISVVKAAFLDGFKGDMPKARDAYEAAGIPVYIMELPRLRTASGPDRTAETRMTGVYKHSLHDMPQRIGNTAFVGGAIQRAKKSSYALVCGQKPGDTAHNMDAHQCAQWARETIELVGHQYQLPVMYRPHPRAISFFDHDTDFGADSVSLPTEETLREALTEAAFLVSYNSTAGVDAIDAGVPAMYTADPAVVCYHQYASRMGDKVRTLTDEERETCLLRLGSCQWTNEQMRSGVMLDCIVNGAVWPQPRVVVMSEELLEERRLELLAAAQELERDAMTAVGRA